MHAVWYFHFQGTENGILCETHTSSLQAIVTPYAKSVVISTSRMIGPHGLYFNLARPMHELHLLPPMPGSFPRIPVVPLQAPPIASSSVPPARWGSSGINRLQRHGKISLDALCSKNHFLVPTMVGSHGQAILLRTCQKQAIAGDAQEKRVSRRSIVKYAWPTKIDCGINNR